MDVKQKLETLRKRMGQHQLAGYVQPVHDEYMSEYPPACNRRAEWLTGFAGSAGTVAVGAAKAALFVDGRYTLQAQQQVDGALFEQHNSASLQPEAWFAGQIEKGDRIGYDPKLYTRDAVSRMQAVLARKGGMLVQVPNLVDAIWEGRPARPSSALFAHAIAYSGEESHAKRQRIAGQVTLASADAAVLAAPDEVCWLLNVRGRDVENTPLALGAAVLHSDGSVDYFMQPSRCNDEVRAHMGNGVTLVDPAEMEQTLKALGTKGLRVLCDPALVPVWFTDTLRDAGAVIVEAQDPCLLPKATKNRVELSGIRKAHIRDGVAVTKLLCWLDTATQKLEITELEVAEKLMGFRAASPLFLEPSFTTITGSGPNGAVVHYRATKASNRVLQKGELFLLDSGGQYPDGTTDITRTVPIGSPSQEHKDRFTRVLKGHIAIATALFPEGTGGSQLDGMARQYLWQVGLDYDHGTGHGVGCFLNVHEGPQRISKRGGDAPLKAGMIVSNEPGYYKAGEYGIRIENLVAVIPKPKGENGKSWLGFETITCVPIDIRLVDIWMLSQQEITWLNSYHAWVLSMLSEQLEPYEREWLLTRCNPIV